MLRYAIIRLLGAVPTLFVIVLMSFFMMRLAPGGPFDRERLLPPEIEAVFGPTAVPYCAATQLSPECATALGIQTQLAVPTVLQELARLSGYCLFVSCCVNVCVWWERSDVSSSQAKKDIVKKQRKMTKSKQQK